jgi:mono/diheme cytochrome c family protein
VTGKRLLGTAAAALLLAGPAWGRDFTGEDLVRRLNCHACHAPAGESRQGAPAWEGLGARLGPQAIRTRLTHPQGRGMPSFAFLRPGELDALVAYLSRW